MIENLSAATVFVTVLPRSMPARLVAGSRPDSLWSHLSALIAAVGARAAARCVARVPGITWRQGRFGRFMRRAECTVVRRYID